MKTETQFKKEKDLCGILFEENILKIEGKEVEVAETFSVFYNGTAVIDGKEAELVMWQSKEPIDLYNPTKYEAKFRSSDPIAMMPGQFCGPQNRFKVNAFYRIGSLEKTVELTEFHDSSHTPEEWTIDKVEVGQNEVLVSRRNNYKSESSGIVTVDLSRHKILLPQSSTLDEKMAEQAVSKVAPRLGYDHGSVVNIKERPDVKLVIWSTENGSTYGYSSAYMVQMKNGQTEVKKIEHGAGQNYLMIDGAEVKDQKLTVTFRDGISYGPGRGTFKRTYEI